MRSSAWSSVKFLTRPPMAVGQGLNLSRSTAIDAKTDRLQTCPTAVSVWRWTRRLLVVALAFAAAIPGGQAVSAGEVLLKNGMRIQGKSAPIQSLTLAVQRTAGEIVNYPLLMIDTGVQRYFVPVRQVASADQADDLSRFEKFRLPQRKAGRKLMLQSVGSYVDVTPFDESGRRRVTVKTSRGPLHIIQGVTEIRPRYVKVIGLSHLWEHGLATTSIPPDVLDAMIRKVTVQQKPGDRMSIARFYLQAGLYKQSLKELDSIAKDFPELAQRVEEVALESRQLLAKRLLGELRSRREAGQHILAYTAAKRFPTEKMSVAVLRDVRELIEGYDEAIALGEKAAALLGSLQAELDKPLVAEVAPMRAEIVEQLDFESIGRLDAFIKLSTDKSLSPAEKLGLAYSGWVLGSANAVPDLAAAIRLWQARFLVMEYLRELDSRKRPLTLTQLRGVEGVGPKTIEQMIPQLPPIIETPMLRTGQVMPICIDDAGKAGEDGNRPPADYHVLLPREYNPHHTYPMIVALRDTGRTAERELVWWGGTAARVGQSQRHGYIVIAPEYARETQREYDYSAAAHQRVLNALVDARKRFNVDSDRVFLAGHGMGGDAVFDIGMSHPDLFAGAIPIAGVSDKICRFYWRNAKTLAWYVIGGELDADTFERNARDLNNMLRNGYDMIYAEYIGRGRETYYEEIHKLFEWMQLHRRLTYPEEFEFQIQRPFDNRFFWLKTDGLPARLKSMKLSAHVNAGNVVYVRSGAKSHTIWLSPKLVTFENRVRIHVNSQRKFNDFVEPSIEVMLDDLRTRGDRQKVYSVKMQF